MKIFFLILKLNISLSIFGQNFQAQYAITQNIDMPLQDNKVFSTTLKYEGFLFKNRGRHIFYLKPLYLTEHQSGVIVRNDKPGSYLSYSLVMDSIQQISYNDTDSLIFRSSFEYVSSGVIRDYSVSKFELGIHEWELQNEKKEINGLVCQRAKLYRDRAKTELIWDIWFCPEININFGPLITRDLPGIMVEGQFFGGGNSFLCELQSYSTPDKINNDVFWPEVFSKAKFEELPPLKRRVSNPPKAKEN